jgi:hypothetical protein
MPSASYVSFDRQHVFSLWLWIVWREIPFGFGIRVTVFLPWFGSSGAGLDGWKAFYDCIWMGSVMRRPASKKMTRWDWCCLVVRVYMQMDGENWKCN